MSSGFNSGLLSLDASVFTTSSGENNNVTLGGSLAEIVCSNELDSITGFDAGNMVDGYLILVVNTGSPTNNLKIKNNSSSSSAGNRILTADGSDYIISPFNTGILGYDTANQAWRVLRIPDVALSSYQATPSDPTGTTNSTGLMMGLAGVITPSKSGKIMIIVSGNILASGIGGGSGAKTQIRYGTGTAPTNGAALTGTAIGNISQIVNPTLALLAPGSGNFTCNAIVSGLTLGTTYWLDQSLARVTSGTATITNISISVVEL